MLAPSVRTRVYIGARNVNGNIERPSADFVANALSLVGVDGATTYLACGVWRGQIEPCRVVEVVSLADPDGARDAEKGAAPTWVGRFLNLLRVEWPQDAYLVTIEPVRAALY